MSAWDTVRSLFSWGKVKVAESDRRVQVELAPGETPATVEAAALNGFYSILSVDDEVLVLRREDGGAAIVGGTARPTGATAGDRGILTSSTHVLVRGSKAYVLKLAGSSPLPVVRDGDYCYRSLAMSTWMGQVEAVCNGVVPAAVTPLGSDLFGAVDASSTKLDVD